MTADALQRNGTCNRFRPGGTVSGLDRGLDGRILPFDTSAAEQAAILGRERATIGRPIAVEDATIAGIGRSRNASIVTRDAGAFAHAGIAVVDPWTDDG